MNLTLWTQRAREAQSRIICMNRRSRKSFVIFTKDLPALRRRLGPRLAAQLVVSKINLTH